ncbi:MAG TPA: polyphosphate polymerase domain-containing protein [Steroidobacteraceae bacterium]|nr:polyphosphate polymerase domain-containing protein [Steroidobacteraceae bacterium]
MEAAPSEQSRAGGSREIRDPREFVYELKFYVGPSQAEALKSWVRERLAADAHGGGRHGDTYLVSSVYFDTHAFAVLGRQGSYARSKYRVRRYNHGDTVYLERKTRGQYRVYKRRTAVGLEALAQLREARPAAEWEGRWFHRRLLARALYALNRVDYQRIARVGYSDYGPVRLTLDERLLAWRARGLGFEVAGEGTPLSTQQLILELKFGHAMPTVFKELIRDFSPRLAGISKYRLACCELGLAAPALTAERLPAGLAHGAHGAHGTNDTHGANGTSGAGGGESARGAHGGAPAHAASGPAGLRRQAF